MKRWSGQLFPILLLGLLAGLSFWLERAVDLPPGRQDGKTRHDPDTVVENFTVRRMDSQGGLRYRLHSPYMEHYPDDDSSLVRSPRLVHYRPGSPEMTLSGDRALITERGDNILFLGNVLAVRAATSGRAELTARMPDLTVRPEDGTAATRSLVEIANGPSRLKGTGLAIDNNHSTFTLQSGVTGLLHRNKPQR